MKRNRVSAILLVLVSFTFIHISTSYSEEAKTIAVLPFTMHADRDLGFLREGIVDMLSSRLTWRDQVRVLDKAVVAKELQGYEGSLDENKALDVGKALQADYVILGSLTALGESVSIDAKILDVTQSRGLLTAFNQSKGMDNVIPTINQFAQDINAKILGREVVAPAFAQATAPPPSGLVQGGTRLAPVRQSSGPLIQVKRDDKGPVKVDRVKQLNLGIVSLDVGDVYGDGNREVVFADPDTIHVYKYSGKNFVESGTIKGGWSAKYLYVSVADLDGNGRAEIYVSNAKAEGVSSFVLEWDGGRFVKTADGQPWFWRVTNLPGKGKVLVGQKRVMEGSYKGGVEILERKGRDFVSAGSVDLPRNANVFDFVKTPLDEGKVLTVLLDQYDHLVVYDAKDERLWRSSDRFGGGFTSFTDKTNYEFPGDEKYVAIPPPIFMYDVNKDGGPELVICQNESSTRRLTAVYQDFSNGKVHFMNWMNGSGFTTSWTSLQVAGAVVGYAIADLDHNGTRELIIASVTASGQFTFKKRSQLQVYELD